MIEYIPHAKILHMTHNINKWLHSSWWKHGQNSSFMYKFTTLKHWNAIFSQVRGKPDFQLNVTRQLRIFLKGLVVAKVIDLTLNI